jgi:geranylgeranyl diphosphate synthase, type I
MTMTKARTSRESLAWGNALLDPALREAVGALAPPARLVSGYHLGWWDEHGCATRGAAGKALRPTLVLLAAEATGGNAVDALPAAVAVELVHNFSLLHDDVMDRDVMRRGRPTAWTVFGIGSAILAGDALLTVALELVATSGHDRADEAVATLGAAVLSLIDGQCADLAFETRSEVGLQECLTMAAAKTGALLGCACALGGLLAGAPDEHVRRLRAFGAQLGLAFQLVDDILGIWGDPDVTGKPASSDLSSRKKSLPVVAALSSGTPAGRDLAPIYASSGPLSEADIVHARELVERSGGRAWSETEADIQRARALEHLETAGLRPRPVAELLALADLVTSRDC